MRRGMNDRAGNDFLEAVPPAVTSREEHGTMDADISPKQGGYVKAGISLKGSGSPQSGKNMKAGGALKKALLFAGTTEGRILAEYMSGLDCHMVVCVATEYGRELLPPGLSVHTGRLDRAGIIRLIEKERPGLIIDATHPYAAQVTENIRTVLREYEDIRLLRCYREPEGDGVQPSSGAIFVPSVEEAVGWLDSQKGNILAATGTKELALYCRLQDYRRRLYVRVLPTVQAIEACRELGIEGSHIMAAQGPFSRELNRAQLREYKCSFLVTKDGGQAGGFCQKLQGARDAGAVTVVVKRPETGEGISLEEIKKQVKKWTDEREGYHIYG